MKSNSKEFLLQKIGGYEICGQTLGKGAFARVELANHCITNTKVALKIINLNDIEEPYTRKNVLRESAILKILRHPNIVRLYETLAHHNTYCFATEYLEGGSLYDHIYSQKQKKFSEKQTRSYFVQLLYAVRYLHSKGIIHRDLKLRNLMLTKDKKTLKLVDFGLSNYFHKDDLLKTRCGSALYAAPELFDDDAKYGPSVEIWSIGVILFVMATGHMPFRNNENDTRENFIAKLRKGMSINHELLLKKINPDLKRLLIQILEPDTQKRIDLEGIYSDVWVTENSRKPLLTQSPEVVPHDIREKIIERVAELYSKPVPDTIKSLKVGSYGSMHATFQILLHKSVWYRRYNHINCTQIPPSSSRASSTSSTKTKSSSQNKSRKNIINVIRISKYNLKGNTTVRAPNNSPKHRYSQRPQTAHHDHQSTNTKESKFYESNERLKDEEEIKLLDYSDSEEIFFEDNDDDEIDTDEESIQQQTFKHPITSCLKISKKSCSSFKEKRQRSLSPSLKGYQIEDEELRQTPFRLTPTTAGKNHSENIKHTKYRATKGTKTIKSTLEGVFELSKSSAPHDDVDDDKEQVLVESDQIRVTISGNKISKGSFKIIHESTGRRSTKKHCKGEDVIGDDGLRKNKPCIRCLSPFEARQMLHRDTFPLKNTCVKPKSSKTCGIRHQNFVYDPLVEGKRTARQHPSTIFQSKKKNNADNDNITNIISTPDSLAKIYQQPIKQTRGMRCTMKTANEILCYENRMGQQYRKNDNNKIFHQNKKMSTDATKTQQRKVSFQL